MKVQRVVFEYIPGGCHLEGTAHRSLSIDRVDSLIFAKLRRPDGWIEMMVNESQSHIPTEVYLDFSGKNDPNSLGLPRHPDGRDLAGIGSALHYHDQIWQTETNALWHQGRDQNSLT